MSSNTLDRQNGWFIEPRGRDEVIDVDAIVFAVLAEYHANSVADGHCAKSLRNGTMCGYRRNRTLLRALLKNTFERSKLVCSHRGTRDCGSRFAPIEVGSDRRCTILRQLARV